MLVQLNRQLLLSCGIAENEQLGALKVYIKELLE